ncbi:MAG: B12-binding domain-containing radical SAM protein, partial [Thermodesulfobacteriota bacterium]
LDENFLLHRKRALRLLELMETHDKSWSLCVFSSARVIQSYTLEQLAGLGVSWVWMGLEGEGSRYRKLNDVDTFDLVGTLQSNGIRVLGSSIIGLEEHTPENIGAAVDYAVAHNTVFHQFMLYTPMPGTPLYESHKQNGTLIPDFPAADTHGQYRFNYRHGAITGGAEEGYLLGAFQQDFDTNGPSLARMIRVMLDGYLRHGAHPDPRIRRRILRESAALKSTYAGAVWAMKAHYKDHPVMRGKMATLLKDLYAAFGLRTRLAAPAVGMFLARTLRKEARRLQNGWTPEPTCFYEDNPAAADLKSSAPGRLEQPATLVPAPTSTE